MASECSVAVGTGNRLKFWAAVRAMKHFCNVTRQVMVSVRGLKPQPIGFNEVLRGAIVRAVEALNEADTDYGVGVEAGPIIVAGVGVELQAAAVVDSQGVVSIGFSQAFMLPTEWVTRMAEGVELGRIAEEATGRRGIGETHGIVSYLTAGRVSRGDLTYEAVLMALIPRLNPELYRKLPHYTELLEALR